MPDIKDFNKAQERFKAFLFQINAERHRLMGKGIHPRTFNVEFAGIPYSGKDQFIEIVPNFLKGKTTWMMIHPPTETVHRGEMPKEALLQLFRRNSHCAKHLLPRPEWDMTNIFVFNGGIYNALAEMELWKMLHEYPERMFDELEKWLEEEMRIKSKERADIMAAIGRFWPGNIKYTDLERCLAEIEIEAKRLTMEDIMDNMDICFFTTASAKKVVDTREVWTGNLVPVEKCLIWFQIKAWNEVFQHFLQEGKPVILLDSTTKSPSQMKDVVLQQVIEKMKDYFFNYVKKLK